MKTLRIYFSWIIPLTLACIPLVFLPLTQDFYDTNKWLLLVVVSCILLFAWFTEGVRTGHVSVSLSPATRGLALISLAALTSLIFVSTNKVEALLHPFGFTTWISLTIVSLLSPVWINQATLRRSAWLLWIGAAILATSALYQFAGLGKLIFGQQTYLTDPIWTPTGSLLGSASIYFILLPFTLFECRLAFKEKNELTGTALVMINIALILGLAVSLWQLMGRLTAVLLPVQYGWAILMEVFKNPRHALFGVGAENFLAAFVSGRPAIMNTTPLWLIRFTTNANSLFHFTTIFGLAGLAAVLYIFKNLIHKLSDGISMSLLLILICLLLIPPNFSFWVSAVYLILLYEQLHPTHTVHTINPGAAWPRSIVGLIGMIVFILGFYTVARAYTAELVFYTSIQASEAKRGTDTYNLLIRAMALNPSVGRYHIASSQTNLALASTLAQTLNTDKNLSDDQRTQTHDLIAQLIQQAIREAKFAVHLNTASILAWENLARTYQELMGIAQGAETWATTSFVQAINLDPTNPVLTLDLGGVLLKKQNYPEAITQFRRAVALKPDYTTAWYNLSYAYRLNGDLPASREAMKQVITLLDKNSRDYQTATKELEDLQKPRPAPVIREQSTPSAVLSAPNPTITPRLEPTLTLPE